ncbi:Fic family protein [Microbacteriaceae bacterium VKM Ac-2854]|nr:Fic family protein [Microbacteriaceae bacterium VKM Ac-2854]
MNALTSEPSRLPYRPFPSVADWTNLEVDVSIFDTYVNNLAATRASATSETNRLAVERATRWAAIDTGAIEGLYDVDRGFTISVAASVSILDAIHEAKSESTLRTISDALAAYEYVLDAATRRIPLTEYWLKELHAIICKSQESYTVYTPVGPQERALELGRYKTEENSPLNLARNEIHSYAPVLDTVPEMARLMEQLRSDDFSALHPVVQAAYAHYAFVCVHPFPDGNGRVSRALASVFLYREPGIPLVIFADQKPAYLDALEEADGGDPSLFVEFVLNCVVDTIGLVEANIVSVGRPPVEDRVKSIQKLLSGRGGVDHAEIDAAGERLRAQVTSVFKDLLSSSDFDAPLSGSVNVSQGSGGQRLTGYRELPSGRSIRLVIQSAAPAQAFVSNDYRIVVARPDNLGADFAILNEDRVIGRVFLREVYPAISESLKYRLSLIMEAEFRAALERVEAAAAKQLKDSGYLA